MPKYVLCPRCELNYIIEGEDYCAVCKAELNIGPQLMFSAEGEVKDQILCPNCKKNYIDPEEEICAACREEYESNRRSENDDSEEWRKLIDEDEKDVMATQGEEEVLLSEIGKQEMFEDEYEDDEIDPYTNEKVVKQDDDFDYVSVPDEEYEDDEEEEEENEDV